METLRAIRKTNTHSSEEKIIRMTADISSEKKNGTQRQCNVIIIALGKKEVNLEFYTEWKYALIIEMK